MILYAPAEAPTDIIQMPDPQLANEEGQRISMDLKTTRNGSLHTYIEKTSDRVLNYTFEGVGRGKIVELQEFFKIHAGNNIRLEDHRGTLWLVKLQSETLDATMDKRAAPILESGSFNLSFIGRQYA